MSSTTDIAFSRRRPHRTSMIRPLLIRSRPLLALLMSWCGALVICAKADDRPAQPTAGRAFQSPATQALQDDDTSNPGMLWVDQGAKLWNAPAGSTGKSCMSCHGEAAQSMKGVAARLPAVDAVTGRLMNLEARIINCRTEHQGAKAPVHESQELLSLSVFISMQSRGLPRTVQIDGAAYQYFQRGKTYWQTRQGQLNLACSQCHDDNVGEEAARGHHQRRPLSRLAQLSTGLARHGVAASTFARVQSRCARRNPRLRIARVSGVGAVSRLARRHLPIESPGVRR